MPYKTGLSIVANYKNANDMIVLKNYADVQSFITKVMEDNKKEGAPPPKSPHKAFWATLPMKNSVMGRSPELKIRLPEIPFPFWLKGMQDPAISSSR